MSLVIVTSPVNYICHLPFILIKTSPMKKISLILCSLYLLSFVTVAQVPQTFNYQDIARDQNGNLMGNESLTVRIAILKEETLIWQEEHSVTTSSIGLFTLNIGDLQASNTGGTGAAVSDRGSGKAHCRTGIESIPYVRSRFFPGLEFGAEMKVNLRKVLLCHLQGIR